MKPTGKRYLVRGFMVAVNQRGISYKVQKDLWVGPKGQRKLARTVRQTIGEVGRMSVKEARSRARVIVSQIAEGEDPNGTHGRRDASTWTVARMWEEYLADMRARDLADCSISDHAMRLERYLPDWRERPIDTVKRSDCRAKHAELAERHGKVTANKVLADFRSSYNFALKVSDDADALPDNPVFAVSFPKEIPSKKVVLPEDIGAWWAKTERLKNPTRRIMQRFGLLSGLRPSTLTSLRRSWYRPSDKALVIPKMKSGRSFALPLSEEMIYLTDNAAYAADMYASGSPCFFPTRTCEGSITATKVVKKRSIPGQTGHILRYTHRTLAQRAGVDSISARLLLDHSVPGMDGVYVHESALFDRLLDMQGKITKEIMLLADPVGSDRSVEHRTAQ